MRWSARGQLKVREAAGAYLMTASFRDMDGSSLTCRTKAQLSEPNLLLLDVS